MGLKQQYQTIAARLGDTLSAMSPRDRILLGGLGAFAFVLLVGGSAWGMYSSLNEGARRVEARAQMLRDMYQMAEEHNAAVATADAIEEELRGNTATSLSAHIEKTCGEIGISDRLDSVREKSTTEDGDLVETLYSVQVSGLSTEELTDFLYALETSGYPLRVKTATIKVSKKSGDKVLGLTMDLAAYKLIETEEAPG